MTNVFLELSLEAPPVPPGEENLRRSSQDFQDLPGKSVSEGSSEQLMGLLEAKFSIFEMGLKFTLSLKMNKFTFLIGRAVFHESII